MSTPSYLTTRRLVRVMRIKRGYTQERLAEKAGLDYKHYQLFELGRTKTPDLKTLEKLAQALDVKLWVLLCDDPSLIRSHAGVEPRTLSQSATRRPGRPKQTIPIGRKSEKKS